MIGEAKAFIKELLKVDKVAHQGVGFAIATVLTLFGYYIGLRGDIRLLVAIFTPITVAVLREVKNKKDGFLFDPFDVVATFLGGLYAIVVTELYFSATSGTL